MKLQVTVYYKPVISNKQTTYAELTSEQQIECKNIVESLFSANLNNYIYDEIVSLLDQSIEFDYQFNHNGNKLTIDAQFKLHHLSEEDYEMMKKTIITELSYLIGAIEYDQNNQNSDLAIEIEDIDIELSSYHNIQNLLRSTSIIGK